MGIVMEWVDIAIVSLDIKEIDAIDVRDLQIQIPFK